MGYHQGKLLFALLVSDAVEIISKSSFGRASKWNISLFVHINIKKLWLLLLFFFFTVPTKKGDDDATPLHYAARFKRSRGQNLSADGGNEGHNVSTVSTVLMKICGVFAVL